MNFILKEIRNPYKSRIIRVNLYFKKMFTLWRNVQDQRGDFGSNTGKRWIWQGKGEAVRIESLTTKRYLGDRIKKMG